MSEPPSASFTAIVMLHGHCKSELTLSQYTTSSHAPMSKTENNNQLVSLSLKLFHSKQWIIVVQVPKADCILFPMEK